MRRYPTDYRLWWIATGVIFSAIWIGILVRSPDLPNKVLGEVGKGAGVAFGVVSELVVVGFVYLVVAAIVGWVVQAAAVLCGFRLRRQPEPTDAADYDDKSPSA